MITNGNKTFGKVTNMFVLDKDSTWGPGVSVLYSSLRPKVRNGQL